MVSRDAESAERSATGALRSADSASRLTEFPDQTGGGGGLFPPRPPRPPAPPAAPPRPPRPPPCICRIVGSTGSPVMSFHVFFWSAVSVSVALARYSLLS